MEEIAMKRKFKIEIEVVDNEAPEETNERSAEGLKDFLMDCLSDLAFDVQKIEVNCE